MPNEELICPFCFTIFPEGALDPDVPVCRECNTYGRAMIVESLQEFIKDTPRQQIVTIKESWQKRSQFLEDERTLVLDNIETLLKMHFPE